MSSALINDYPIMFLPHLAKAIGVNEALVLQQLHYWLINHAEVQHDGKFWIYKTYEEWQEQDFFFWSVRTVKSVFKSLLNLELIESAKLSTNRHNRVNYYTINQAKLSEITAICEAEFEQKRLQKLAKKVARSCTFDSAKVAQSDSAKVAQSDSAKVAQCLREQEENNQENKKEIFFEVHNLKATLEQIQSHFVMAGVLVKFDETLNVEVLRQELYQFNLNYHHQDLPPNKVWSNLVAWFKRKSHKDLARFNTVSHDEQLAPSHVVAPVIQEPIQQLSREERLAKIAQIEKAMGVNRAT